MWQGQQQDQWVHTTHLLCMAANVARSDKSQPLIKFDDLYPFAAKLKRESAGASTSSETPIEDIQVARAFWQAMCQQAQPSAAATGGA